MQRDRGFNVRPGDQLALADELARLDGENAVSLIVQKQSGTNTVEVVHAVKERLQKITPFLPGDIKTVIIRDQSRFIEASIGEVKFHLVLAAILVSLTILLFIRDWRTTIIATLATLTPIRARPLPSAMGRPAGRGPSPPSTSLDTSWDTA